MGSVATAAAISCLPVLETWPWEKVATPMGTV